ncbi:NAD(P)-binding protein [Streptomyces sp. NPDC088180]|uniref:NAD(P)-binding protein n=1 Tax=Streptomyces sp. NPDC088180 TaxID=3365837 RepID=UPI0038077696
MIIGTGPNGLAAGAPLSRGGLRVDLYERDGQIGRGPLTTSLSDSDVVHDICSAVHPVATASRVFREFDLAARSFGLDGAKGEAGPIGLPPACVSCTFIWDMPGLLRVNLRSGGWLQDQARIRPDDACFQVFLPADTCS